MKKGHTINVLDHGFVRYVDHLGSDERIVEAARISYKSPSKGEEQDKKLLKYLYKNLHTSPFEQCSITFNIKLPIFIMRQMVRHRTARLNEMSARYTELPSEFYIPEKWRIQDTKNKQGSIEKEEYSEPQLVVPKKDGHMGENGVTKYFEEHCEYSYELYQSMIEAGIAREMARMVLPVNIYTEIYWNMDLKNLIHFIRLRDDSHAQWEIQQYGKAIKEITKELFPWTIEAYEEFSQH
jgi:thymidylate synthase (FAD)